MIKNTENNLTIQKYLLNALSTAIAPDRSADRGASMKSLDSKIDTIELARKTKREAI